MKLVGACLGLLAVLVATQSAWADVHIDLSSPDTADYPAFNVGTAIDPGPNRALILCEYCTSLNNALKFLRMGTLPLTPLLVAGLDALQVFMITRSSGTANLVQWTF